jgi:hypothetical protein
MRTVKSVIGSSALVMVLAASSAMAQSQTPRLKGEFAFTGSHVCVGVTPPSGFSADLIPLGDSFVTTFSIQGVRIFNGDGTGSMTARIVALGDPGAANARDLSAQFTYSVAADGTVTIDDEPTDVVTVAGPGVGGHFKISDTPTLVGRLSSDRKSLTFATFNPGVEVVTRVVPAPEQVIQVRICHRERIGIRISQEDD